MQIHKYFASEMKETDLNQSAQIEKHTRGYGFNVMDSKLYDRKLKAAMRLASRMDLEITSAISNFEYAAILNAKLKDTQVNHTRLSSEVALRSIRCGVQFGYGLLKILSRMELSIEEFNTYRALLK